MSGEKKENSEKKKSKKKKNKSEAHKFKITNTIGASLTMGLLFAAAAIMLVCFTISIDVLNSVKKNAVEKFYSNAFDAAVQNRIKTNSDLILKQAENKTLPVKYIIKSDRDLFNFKNEMNRMLSREYQVSEIYISEELNKDSLQDNYSTMRGKNTIPESALEKRIAHETGADVISKAPGKLNFIAIPKYEDEKKTKLLYTIYLLLEQKNIYEDNLISSLASAFIVIALICAICISLLVRSITKPLNTMEKTVSQIAKGDLSGRLDYTKYDEINKLAKSYNIMANALQRLYSSLEAKVNDRTQELKKAYAELQNTQAMMVHSEKMKSLGELVAGIMHEINNPINFIYGNMTHLSAYSGSLIEIIDEYTKYEGSLKDEEKKKIEELKKTADYEFLKTDMPDLIKSCKEGADRAKNIIQDLKSFSRMEELSIRKVDIAAEIETVLNILHNKLKNKARIHKEYMENMPQIDAFGGQLNQVFMNILDNAAGAIENAGDIWIRINPDASKKNLVIEIEDNGEGMDEETMSKVFDPFFTTKPVGKGTGLGMSITYKIVKNHQGDIRVISRKGQGSKFIVTLPVSINKDSLKTEEVQNG